MKQSSLTQLGNWMRTQPCLIDSIPYTSEAHHWTSRQVPMLCLQYQGSGPTCRWRLQSEFGTPAGPVPLGDIEELEPDLLLLLDRAKLAYGLLGGQEFRNRREALQALDVLLATETF